jgi:hypothetical protein
MWEHDFLFSERLRRRDAKSELTFKGGPMFVYLLSNKSARELLPSLERD